MATESEYVTEDVYNDLDEQEKIEVIQAFQSIRLANRWSEPFTDDGLRLFVMLGLLNPVMVEVRCMAQVRTAMLSSLLTQVIQSRVSFSGSTLLCRIKTYADVDYLLLYRLT